MTSHGPRGPDDTDTTDLADTICERLKRDRRELLDLGTRTRLLNTPRRQTRVKTVEVVDELSDQVFRILVGERKSMSFLEARASAVEAEASGEVLLDESFYSLLQPEDDEVDEQGVPRRHTDSRLQTNLSSDRLQKRLLALYYDARTAEEEQGVSILYLALGFLKWYEADSSDKARYAPLILLPVDLDRRSARARFRVSFSDQELATNLSLQTKLDLEFGVKLPELPDADDLVPSTYFKNVSQAVEKIPRWEVLADDMVLGMFSFAKFLMYRDLDPDNWPAHSRIQNNGLLQCLLGDGFDFSDPRYPDDAHVDRIVDPADQVHVVDADSSQTLAIEEVRSGRNLVIQGPPGTGKSQTITNLIAAAVKDGQRVLFVAEKRAALDVVKRRLDQIDLGSLCLELHSHQARKKVVLEELERTLSLGRPKYGDHDVASNLKEKREQLNRHAEAMNTPIGMAEMTPYCIIGELVRLSSAGVAACDFKLSAAREWTREDLRKREEVINDLAAVTEDFGIPTNHPWKGANVAALLPTDIDRLTPKLESVFSALQGWVGVARQLGETLGRCPESMLDVERLIEVADIVVQAPDMDRAAFAASAWKEQRKEVRELVEAGVRYHEARKKLKSVLVDQAWDIDLAATRAALAAHGKSVFRFFVSEYRAARQTLKGLAVDREPKALPAQLYLLDELSAGQQARNRVLRQSDLGQEVFGSRWRSEDSSWPTVAAIEHWERDNARRDWFVDLHQAVAAIGDQDVLNQNLEVVRDQKPRILGAIQDLVQPLEVDLTEAFAQRTLDVVPLGELLRTLEAWLANPSALQKWVTFRITQNRARELGLGDLASRLYDGRLSGQQLIGTFRMASYEELLRMAWEAHPGLAAFSGQLHEQVIQEFCKLDTERIRLARQEVALAHHEQIPRGASGIGELGLVRREIQKKRRHLSIRRLMSAAGKALQGIKPVFMMSPMSVAQFLEPGVVEFDLLLIDEASQVQPIDALGAIARCRQLAVVGDERQLPPTTFFTKLIAGDETLEDDGTFSAADVESILGLCTAQGVPDKMLRWHYRSQHESLIAGSNRQFYDDRLFVVPSAVGREDLGLKFRFVEGGVFDRGGSAVNRVEAQAVAKAVLDHAKTCPDLSLGVGAFSIRQRDAILDELELLRRKMPECERFFSVGQPEPFFVKNLETLQGDERDVVLVSVGYARDASGFMAMSFGPLSAEGGERRLNVLMTRARKRCELFSSVRAGDVDLNRGRGFGVRALKMFLQYAETGQLDVAQTTGREPDSPFEEEVGNRLKRRGHEIDYQVGVAGFYVDIGVRDPGQSGSYLLSRSVRKLPARNRMRWGYLSLSSRREGPRPHSTEGPRGPQLDDSPHLEYGLVSKSPR
jgi:hypothetical protein